MKLDIKRMETPWLNRCGCGMWEHNGAKQRKTYMASLPQWHVTQNIFRFTNFWITRRSCKAYRVNYQVNTASPRAVRSALPALIVMVSMSTASISSLILTRELGSGDWSFRETLQKRDSATGRMNCHSRESKTPRVLATRHWATKMK